MKPRTEAIAFRIWQFCEPRGWNATLQEIGEALDVPWRSVRQIVRHKGWANRLRAQKRDFESTPDLDAIPAAKMGPSSFLPMDFDA